MPTPRQVHRGGTTVMSLLMVVIGIAILVRTITSGGGALALGIVLGALFVLGGAGRLWVARRSA